MALLRLVFLALCLCFVLHTVSAGRSKKNGKRNGGGRRSKKVNGATKKNGGGGGGGALVTCPGFAGYCSESYPGDTCLVVCAFGRNNVPVCQHEPGRAEQVPGQCPGVPGYCSLDLPGGLCTFECARGKHIRSSCLPDGTWDPYPTCEGDVRETKDGCDPCPGPFGGPRNRTAEAGGRGGAKPASGGRGGGARPASGGRGGGGRPAAGGHAGGGRPAARGGNRGSNRGASQVRNTGGSRGGQKKKSGGRRKTNGGTRRNMGGNRKTNARQQGKSNRGGGGGCPDSVLEACIDACPGASPKIFGTCVAGCSKRCQ